MWIDVFNLRDKSQVMINTDLIWKIEAMKHASAYRIYLYRSLGEGSFPFDVSEADYIKVCDKLGLEPCMLDDNK